MICKICNVEEAKNNSIVCSDDCTEIRLLMIKLVNICAPTNGCDNCWGDLGGGCTEKCKREFENSGKFAKELYSLVQSTLKITKQ